jgi:transaldolase
MTLRPDIKIYLDTADLSAMKKARDEGLVAGFTTNPSLMRKAGVANYEAYCREALAALPGLPVSFEVFADDLDGMEREARRIATWGKQVFVKIPYMNSKREPTLALIRKLSAEGFQLNITLLFTVSQMKDVAEALAPASPALVSFFAGRVADAGQDPEPMCRQAAGFLAGKPKAELLWASTREPFNIIQAARSGCKVITAPPDIVAKLKGFGKDLEELCQEGAAAFFKDSQAAGFKLD